MENKIKVCDLAKQMKTSSNRIMEKLSEINIYPKSHMSYLEGEELQAFYDHVGYNPDSTKQNPKNVKDDKKNVANQITQNATRQGVVIRRIFVDSETENNASVSGNTQESYNADKHDNKQKNKNNNKRVSRIAGSDLRQGYEVRSKEDFDYIIQDSEQDTEKESVNMSVNTDEVRADGNDAGSQEDTPKVKRISKQITTNIDNNKKKPQSDNKDKTAEREKTVSVKAPEAEKIDIIITRPTQEKEKPRQEEKPKPEEKTIEKEIPQEAKIEEKSQVANTEIKLQEKQTDVKPQEEVKPVETKTETKTEIKQENVEKKPEKAVKNIGENVEVIVTEKKVFNKDANKKPYVQQVQKGPSDRPRNDRRPEPAKPVQTPDLKYTNITEVIPEVKHEVKKEKEPDVFVKKETKKTVQKPFVAPSKDKYKKTVKDLDGDGFIDSSETFKGKSKKNKKPALPVKPAQKIVHKPLSSVKLPEVLTVKDFAEAIKKTSAEVIKRLMMMGVMVNLNQEIDFDTAAIIAGEFGITAVKEVSVTEEDILFEDESDETDPEAETRPPVVVVMGHVDHGKTSLLDAIRKTSVIATEAGGITQHIGAYMVRINGRNITFLDTPGHEAFTAMRARGAQVTDVAILVVAADDGVMPQTIEAINHAKAAKVQIVVAVNKIDKPGADPERIKQQLTEYGVVSDEWGGDVPFVYVSAKFGKNIDELLETVLLTADLMDLKANPNRQAKGTIIEAKLDKNRGPVATLLVQRGTLKPGDAIISGSTFGKIRTMSDDKGHSLKKAGPSTPVEVTGFPEVPEAGEIFYAVKDEHLAKQLTEKRRNELREKQLRSSAKISLNDLYTQIKEGKVKDLNIIVKADVQGSVEAVRQSLEKLSNDEVRVNIIHGGVGAVTDSDVTLAEVSNAIIIGFNVRPGVSVAEHAESAGVDLRLYRVIYDAIEDIQSAMKGMLEPEYKEVVQGMAEIRQIFKVSGVGTIAGAYVTTGKIVRNSDVRIVREGIIVFEGKLASLKRFKDDVREVAKGFECGLSIERFNDIKEGDVVESFVMEEIKRQ